MDSTSFPRYHRGSGMTQAHGENYSGAYQTRVGKEGLSGDLPSLNQMSSYIMNSQGREEIPYYVGGMDSAPKSNIVNSHRDENVQKRNSGNFLLPEFPVASKTSFQHLSQEGSNKLLSLDNF